MRRHRWRAGECNPPPVFARFLSRQSEGNPFFIAEYLRAAIDAGLLFRAPSGEWLFEAGIGEFANLGLCTYADEERFS